MARACARAELALLLTTTTQVIAEEFLPMTTQTRITALTKNAALGWLLASLPWAVLHVPAWIGSGDSLQSATRPRATSVDRRPAWARPCAAA